MIAKSALILTVLVTANAVIYEPTWESIDSRPLPEWYDEAKLGIFIHWGVYSVPGFVSEWFWAHWNAGSHGIPDFMYNNYPPGFTYQEFAKDFKAEFFNPTDWAYLFQNSGAKYIVLTTKHHEGYNLWPASRSFSWNSKDVGSHRDLVGELADAIRGNTNLKVGLYHSLLEWFNPMYMSDQANGFSTDVFVREKFLPEIYELVNKYHPDVVWADGEWEAPHTYWKATEFIAWLYNESPVKDTVVTNDRWGNDDINCKHGGVHTCYDRFNPGVLQEHKWENAMTIDKQSWGYRRNAKIEDFFTIHELIKTLTETVSCGGNLLMNVGPTADGMIPSTYQERLLEMGRWLNINGEAIYATKPWLHQNDISSTWYTSKPSVVYAIVLYWPVNNKMNLEKVVDLFQNNNVTISLLGNDGTLQWEYVDNRVQITFPDKATVNSEWVWVLKMEYATEQKKMN